MAYRFTLVQDLSGCSGNSGLTNPNATPPGPYPIMVIAGDGTTSKTAGLSLTVN